MEGRPPVSRKDYFTYWSLVVNVIFAVVFVSLSFVKGKVSESVRNVLSAGVVSNASAVGLMGAAVIAYGNVRGSEEEILKSNFFLHSLPAALCLPFVAGWKRVVSRRPSPKEVATAGVSLLLLDAAYLLFPDKSGRRGLSKVRNVYGTDPLPFCVGGLIAQAAFAASLLAI